MKDQETIEVPVSWFERLEDLRQSYEQNPSYENELILRGYLVSVQTILKWKRKS